jgi:putative addiction module component (TIGR02574 family)
MPNKPMQRRGDKRLLDDNELYLPPLVDGRRSWREIGFFDRLTKTLYTTAMNAATNISIETLSTTEKLILMERLWTDLSRCPSEIQSPDWHGDVLSARLQAVQDGKTQFVNWDDAKKRLRERLE